MIIKNHDSIIDVTHHNSTHGCDCFLRTYTFSTDRKTLRYTRLDLSDDVCHLRFSLKNYEYIMGLRNLSSRWSYYSWLSFESLFFSIPLSIWSEMFFLIRKLYFLMMRSGANYVKIHCFKRSTVGLFLIELLYPFTEWLIRYDSELKIGFITKIVSSFLLDCFFFIFVIYSLSSYERCRDHYPFCRRYWNWNAYLRIRFQLSPSKRTSSISISRVSSPIYHVQLKYFRCKIVIRRITYCLDLFAYEFLFLLLSNLILELS